MRLPETSPAKHSFHEFERAIKLPRGRPQTTWIGSEKKQLKIINVEWENAKSITTDRAKWRKIVKTFKDTCLYTIKYFIVNDKIFYHTLIYIQVFSVHFFPVKIKYY